MNAGCTASRRKAAGTITQGVLASLRVARVVEYKYDKHHKALSIGWPAESAAARSAPVQKARDLFGVFEAYFKAEFPMFEEANYFSAFNLQAKLSLDHRKEMLSKLAVRRGMDPDAAWAEMGGHVYPVSGLLARAEWHASDNGQLQSAVREADAPKATFRDPTSKNCLAWIRTLRELGNRGVAARQNAVILIETALVFLVRTTNVERWLGIVALIELKHRAHHLKIFRLVDAVKLAIQDLLGRRPPGAGLDAMALLVITSSSAAVWRGTPYCTRAQNVYRDFYGERAFACRSLTPLSVEQQAAVQIGKPALGRVQASSVDSRSYQERLRAHSAGIKRAVESLPESSRPPREEATVVGSRKFFGESASGAASSQSLPCTPAGLAALVEDTGNRKLWGTRLCLARLQACVGT